MAIITTMAYLVARPRGRWEIRESRSTPDGPRSRTLASFRTLSADVIARASAASATELDAVGVLEMCRRAGVPFEERRADQAARALLEELRKGQAPAAPLRQSLAEALARARPSGPVPHPGGARDWIGADAAERGEALRQLLDFTDKLPPRPKRPLQFPRLQPRAVS